CVRYPSMQQTGDTSGICQIPCENWQPTLWGGRSGRRMYPFKLPQRDRRHANLLLVQRVDPVLPVRSFRERSTFGLGSKPDENHPDDVDEGYNNGHAGVAATERSTPHGAAAGDDASEIVCDPLGGGADTG